MTAYYNEIDPFAADWLRSLIAAGHIAPGEVDERDIQDVKPSEIRDYKQCHFFAGIGVWSYALRQSGWPDDQPVWTGSCPCQPFSAAGKGKGVADERHLWPAFFYLIEAVRPKHIFGEQVASKDGLGWFDLVQTDLEGAGYASGAVDSCAAGFGAPHLRQRLYFAAEKMAESLPARRPQGRAGSGIGQASGGCDLGDLANPNGDGCEPGGEAAASTRQEHTLGANVSLSGPNPTNGLWSDVDWLGCRDGKWRPVRPGTFPLAHGTSNRVGRLRGYGNAIVAPQAQAFIEAFIEWTGGLE